MHHTVIAFVLALLVSPLSATEIEQDPYDVMAQGASAVFASGYFGQLTSPAEHNPCERCSWFRIERAVDAHLR